MGARRRLGETRRSVDRSREKEPVTSLRSQAEPGAGQKHTQNKERQDPGAESEREGGLGWGAGGTVAHVAHPHGEGYQQQQKNQKYCEHNLHGVRVPPLGLNAGTPSCEKIPRLD